MLLLHHHDTRIYFLALQALAFEDVENPFQIFRQLQLVWETITKRKIEIAEICRYLWQNSPIYLLCFFPEI